MIVKKIERSRIKRKAASIHALADYIRAPQKRNPAEKVLYAAGRGFLTDSHAGQREEMIALASEAVRSKNPVNHYVMSWPEGEQPSPAQIEEAVTIFTQELGVPDHQVIYALHRDTDNLHLHLAINRVHPDTLKCIEINRGFDIEAAHRAIARIEHAQGWQPERNARYQVLESGELGREHLDPDKPRQPGQRQRDMESRTGEKSAERLAIEEGAPIIKRAQSWAQLHRELAEHGMRYQKTGSGAVLFVGAIGVKASSADRQASLAQLQKRLGPYEPPAEPQQQQAPPRAPQPIKPDVPGWGDYIAGRRAHYAAKAVVRLEQDLGQQREHQALAGRQKGRRDEILRGPWKGKGKALNALRSVLAAEQAAEKAALKDRHRQERAQYRERFRPYPDLEQWQRLRQHPELAEQWRHRASEPQHTHGGDPAGDQGEPPAPRDIRDFRAEVVGQQVHYFRRDEAAEGGGASFVDHGRTLAIHDWRDRDTTLAALQLSAQKWGRFTVTGNDEYKALCVQLAAEHGFRITNPELQQALEQARQRLQRERAEAVKSGPLKKFDRYSEAVAAERYRVTSIRRRADGSRQTFLLGRKDGITEGFTPQEIAQRVPEMQRLQERGEHLRYTPLSADKHHIVIDEMGREKLRRLIGDGYQPAVVLESSPGNYQAILTVPKLGTAHDQDVGDRLARQLNREYGDPELPGGIPPHHAPGYENREPEHRREDGSPPEVRLLKTERRECAKTLALSSQIDAEYQRQAALKSPQPEHAAKRRSSAFLAMAASGGGAAEAYEKHYRNVLKRQRGGKPDPSRVDSTIAVRLRVTGHGQADIEGAIRQCAPAIRQGDEGRNWQDYAQRAARFAFSVAGDRQAEELARYRQQWQELEGREPSRPSQPAPKSRRDHLPRLNR